MRKLFYLMYFVPFCLFSSILPFESPTVKYLKSTEISELSSGIDSIDCIYVINLDTRLEKWQRMKALFDERGVHGNRVSGVRGIAIPEEIQQELAGPYPIRLPKGALGCLLSHISVIKDAYERGFNRIWVFEDDVEFHEDVRQIPELLANLSEIDPSWDVFYTDVDSKNGQGNPILSLGSDFRPDQRYHPLEYYTQRRLVSNNIMKIGQRFGLYSFIVSRGGMKKILDYFTHVYLWTAVDVDIHYIPNIREYSTVKDIVSVWVSSGISDNH